MARCSFVAGRMVRRMNSARNIPFAKSLPPLHSSVYWVSGVFQMRPDVRTALPTLRPRSMGWTLVMAVRSSEMDLSFSSKIRLLISPELPRL